MFDTQAQHTDLRDLFDAKNVSLIFPSFRCTTLFASNAHGEKPLEAHEAWGQEPSGQAGNQTSQCG